MTPTEFVTFVRQRGLAVVASRGPDGSPQAALVGVAATDDAELVFDTAIHSRKYHNIRAFPYVAVVIGWHDEVTVQCEGVADILTGAERNRCLRAYLDQYPDGRGRRGSRDRPYPGPTQLATPQRLPARLIRHPRDPLR